MIKEIIKPWFGATLALSVFMCVACLATDHCSETGSNDPMPGTTASTGTFRTTNLIVDDVSDFGNINTGITNLNGPTRQTLSVPGGPAYPYGELNLKTITGSVPTAPNDLFVDVIRNSATADCTAANQHSGAMALEVTSTRSAGAFSLTNTALELTASGGQTNEALHVLAGDIAFDGGGAFTQAPGGYAFFSGQFLATGASTPLIPEGNGTYAVYISANPGPTDSIRSLAPDPSWNAKNVTGSTLKVWNEDAVFTLDIAGPALHTLWRPDGIVTISAGAFTTGSTTLVGGVTAVGADTTVITFANAFANRSRCFATIASATPQVITAVGTSTDCTFRCFDPTTGLAANCEDFSYEVVGQ